jgi:hypothetical protein
MTKNEIVNEILNNNGPILNINNVEEITIDSNTYKRYIVNVFETGLSETKKPIAVKRNIEIYVKNESTLNEEAFYKDYELQNRIDVDVTGDTTLLGISKIFSSPLIRKRVLGALLTYSIIVFNESAAITNHNLRLKLAFNIAQNINENILNLFMTVVANNSNVQNNGNSISDAALITIVTNVWTTIAVSLYS